MEITIRPEIMEQIKCTYNGFEVANKLTELAGRSNTEYHRGILHGYLLALSVTGVITNNDALEILEQLYE